MTGRVAAFFDIDCTVLEINSGTQWIRYLRRTGKMGLVELIRALGWTVQYKFGWLDFESMARRVLRGYVGKEVAPLEAEVEQWFRDEIAWSITTQARASIASHQDEGHVVALLTSATRFLSRPVANAVSVQHILCTEVEEAGGRFTGNVIEPLCYGPGKVEKAERFARDHGIDLEASFFYTDSVSDLPMLERVGEPRVINPDPRLRRRAAEVGWSVAQWTAPQREGADAGAAKEAS